MRIPNQPTPPLGTADASYPIEVVYDTWRIYADTPEEVLGLLIDGYADLGDEPARRQARLRLALAARAMVQTLLNASEQFDLSTDEEKRVLLDQADAPPAISEWECAIPLVLVTVFYQPVGELKQPHVTAPGQVWWIDPSTAPALLSTLHQVRWLDLARVDVPVDVLGTREVESGAYQNLGRNGAAGYWWRSV
jgi:hypothetical protein